MNKYSYKYNGFTFERVSKQTARKYYNAGFPVVFCPCNLRPGFPWNPEIIINPKQEDIKSFDQVLNSFIFYNIRDTETGLYTAFYIPVNNDSTYNYDFIQEG